MLYTEWISAVLRAATTYDVGRARLVGLPVASLGDTLHVPLEDSDAIADAVYDLEVLGLARQRPNGFFNLTAPGRLAATSSIEDVCGETIREACATLTAEERRFVQALVGQSVTAYDRFVRGRYVNVDPIFEQIGVALSNEQQESFLLPLVEKSCIDYQEFQKDRDARPLYTAVMCAGESRVG